MWGLRSRQTLAATPGMCVALDELLPPHLPFCETHTYLMGLLEMLKETMCPLFPVLTGLGSVGFPSLPQMCPGQ